MPPTNALLHVCMQDSDSPKKLAAGAGVSQTSFLFFIALLIVLMLLFTLCQNLTALGSQPFKLTVW